MSHGKEEGMNCWRGGVEAMGTPPGSAATPFPVTFRHVEEVHVDALAAVCWQTHRLG